MRTRRAAVSTLLGALVACSWSAGAADPPRRKPLDPGQRTALLSLIDAVDRAQERNADFDGSLTWDHHILKARDQIAYVPFRLTLTGQQQEPIKSALLYVRAVSRHDGVPVTEEHSTVRDWVLRGGDAPPARTETVFIGPGEMPVGGPAAASGRRSIQAPAEASALLALQHRAYEKQKAADEAAKRKAETPQRDPYVFPFEDYHFVDVKATRGPDARTIERALGLPAGEYDVYVALVDRTRAKSGAPAILKRTVTVPDYWNDALALSSLMLTTSINTLGAALPPQQQVERPYALGRAEVVPVRTSTFTTSDVLSVAFQICNYGAPDSDLTADYNFYREENGARRLFNRTSPQQLTDADLPPSTPWETQAFTTQSVPLTSFPPGRYELEVTVRDRLTRGTAKQSVAFTVQ
jgi:hypothetical protein